MNVMQPLLMSFPTDMSSYIIESTMSNANMTTAILTKSIFCTLGTAANSFHVFLNIPLPESKHFLLGAGHSGPCGTGPTAEVELSSIVLACSRTFTSSALDPFPFITNKIIKEKGETSVHLQPFSVLRTNTVNSVKVRMKSYTWQHWY